MEEVDAGRGTPLAQGLGAGPGGGDGLGVDPDVGIPDVPEGPDLGPDAVIDATGLGPDPEGLLEEDPEEIGDSALDPPPDLVPGGLDVGLPLRRSLAREEEINLLIPEGGIVSQVCRDLLGTP